jgi:hypothetical protein
VPTNDSLPKRKPSRRYLLWRFYAVVGILVFWACCLRSMYAMLTQGDAFDALTIAGIAFGVPAIFLIMNWFAFPWPYSVFGPYSRRSASLQGAGRLLRSSGAVIGSLNATVPMVTWSFFDDGVGIDVELIGKAYLPADCITRIEKRSFGRYVVYHQCVELRSPVTMPRAAYTAMLSSLDEQHRRRLMTV